MWEDLLARLRLFGETVHSSARGFAAWAIPAVGDLADRSVARVRSRRPVAASLVARARRDAPSSSQRSRCRDGDAMRVATS
jgi:hypothetical protein